MPDNVYRCYVEKRPGFDIASNAVKNELSTVLGLEGIALRLFNRYDVQGLPDNAWLEVS